MARGRFASLALLSASVIMGLLAAAISFVSDAHGHGLASGDRRAIILLATGSAVSLGTALVLLAKRSR